MPLLAKKYMFYSSLFLKAVTQHQVSSIELPTASHNDQDNFAPGSSLATFLHLKLNKTDNIISLMSTSLIFIALGLAN